MPCTLSKSDIGKCYQLTETIFARKFPAVSFYLVSFNEKTRIAAFAEWPDWKPRIFLKQEDLEGEGDLQWRRWLKIGRTWLPFPGAIGQNSAKYSLVEVQLIHD